MDSLAWIIGIGLWWALIWTLLLGPFFYAVCAAIYWTFRGYWVTPLCLTIYVLYLGIELTAYVRRPGGWLDDVMMIVAAWFGLAAAVGAAAAVMFLSRKAGYELR